MNLNRSRTLVRLENNLEKFIRGYLYHYPTLAKTLQRSLIYPRHWIELALGRSGYIHYGKQYKNPNIVILGLPKSGTTWLEKALSSLPGFQSTMLPGMLLWGLKRGEGLGYAFPDKFFEQHKNKLLIIKTHSVLSSRNLRLLRKHQIKYILVYRDIRDVAISYVHFVKSRPWHPQYPFFKDLSLDDALILFATRLAPEYLDWIIQSLRVLDDNGMVVTYEQMRSDFQRVFQRVCVHCGIDINTQIIKNIELILASADYKESTHFRKGDPGEWRNVFSEKVKDVFKNVVGKEILLLGFEQAPDW